MPDARIGDRQRACEKAECRREYRRRSQAKWRKQHPGYFIEWRARERAARNATEPVDPPRLLAPLSSLPWGLAQEEFGIAGADFLGSMGRLLLGHAKDEMGSQGPAMIGESGQVGPGGAKAEMSSQALVTTVESPQVGPADAKDEIGAVSG